jgi:HD superfamily phosphohydrolase
MSKIIHCAIWGDIEVSALARQIIDTPIFQRLHYIRQCGFSYKVFPCSTHTRFQHSIGVYYLVKLFLNTILTKQPSLNTLSLRTIELIAISGLIHDIGHGPFSHAFDILVSQITERDDTTYVEIQTHEKRTEWLFRYMVKEYQIDLSLDEMNYILSKINDPNQYVWYDHLVYNPFYYFDLDKIDYLLRDSHYFGLQQKIDVTRILQNCRVKNNQLCFSSRIVDEIQFVFELRNKMYHSIYNHHKIKVYENLFVYLCETYYKNDILYSLRSPLRFIELTDISLLSFLHSLSIWRDAEIRKNPLSIIIPPIVSRLQRKEVISIQSILESIPFYDRKTV